MINYGLELIMKWCIETEMNEEYFTCKAAFQQHLCALLRFITVTHQIHLQLWILLTSVIISLLLVDSLSFLSLNVDFQVSCPPSHHICGSCNNYMECNHDRPIMHGQCNNYMVCNHNFWSNKLIHRTSTVDESSWPPPPILITFFAVHR